MGYPIYGNGSWYIRPEHVEDDVVQEIVEGWGLFAEVVDGRLQITGHDGDVRFEFCEEDLARLAPLSEIGSYLLFTNEYGDEHWVVWVNENGVAQMDDGEVRYPVFETWNEVNKDIDYTVRKEGAA